MGHAGDDALTLVRVAGWIRIKHRFTKNDKPGCSAGLLDVAPQQGPDRLSSPRQSGTGGSSTGLLHFLFLPHPNLNRAFRNPLFSAFLSPALRP